MDDDECFELLPSPKIPAEDDLLPIGGAEDALISALIDIELALVGNPPPVDLDARIGEETAGAAGERRGGALMNDNPPKSDSYGVSVELPPATDTELPRGRVDEGDAS